MNIAGQTLHSFAGVGLGEGDPRDLLQRVTVQQNARRRWQTCRTLVVDEVSMIDAALFDKLEYIARMIRKNPLPFGGIQLILTGDFLQLPPVKGGAGFCFESRSWSDCVPVTIELQSVFRQDDSSLVGILNNLRRGVVDKAAVASMQSCINRKFDTTDGIEATELFAMKRQVSEENDDRLAKLDAAEVEYRALDKGTATYLEQLTRSCNAVERLVLKEGAQVMLLKNLTSALVNGSRGVVVSFDVQEADDMQMEHRRVSPAGRWPRVKFTNGSEMTLLPERWDVEVSNKSVASRTQVPLMLAWSLTVHKCQGMTLDRVRLHLGSIFEYGQAYVALSRIRSLDSLSIKDTFPQSVIRAHPKAIRFYDELHKRNGHSNSAQPAPEPPTAKFASAAFIKRADIPDPFADADEEAYMDINDELIAMAASDGFETNGSSSASQYSPAALAERDTALSSATSFSPASLSAFVRASNLPLSLSQPASSSSAAPSRGRLLQHFTPPTASAFNSPSVEVSSQSSVTAATVRRHQLLLKRKPPSTDAQTINSRAVAASSGDSAAASDSPSPPRVSPSHVTRGEEIDLISDDDSEPTAAPKAAIERTEGTANTTTKLQQQSTATAKNQQPEARSPTPSVDLSASHSVQSARPGAVAFPSATAQLAATEQPTSRSLPPVHSGRCSPHDRPLQAQLDWNKENEPGPQVMAEESAAGLLKGEPSGGGQRQRQWQWLYRCELGCMLAVTSTT